MKIGILTFHRANNLGAVLQASALQKYMHDNYGNSELIDFYPNNSIPNNTLIHKILRAGKRCIISTKKINILKREKSFNEYRDKYYVCSINKYYGDENIYKNPPRYDVLISGSDQILNMTLTGNTLAYYLGFDDSAKKISYASSFGRTNLSDEELKMIRTELPKFDAISVREESARLIINNEINIEPRLVLDPVFLISQADWSQRCNEKLKLPDKYIFVYSMEDSDNMERVVLKAKEIYNLPIIVVRGGGTPGKIYGKEDFSCGPSEFLRYLRDADLVITNSFHGVAMSMIFEKKLYCIAHSKRNTRIENITQISGCFDRIIDNDTEIDKLYNLCIDRKVFNKNLNQYVQISKDYISQAII
jgi:polysaccharide pyruvyl transferase WcaK-like protein